jgi:hypothetical protein
VGRCPICGIEFKTPVREIDLGSWSMTLIREYECCDRKFREYERKSNERLKQELYKKKIVRRFTTLNRESLDHFDDDEWNSEESFTDADEW